MVSPETGEDLDIWEVDLFQELGKPLLSQERTAGGVLAVCSVLGRHEEIDTGCLGGLCEDFLLIDGDSGDSADHDIDAFEGSDNAVLVGVVDLYELSSLCEPLRVGRLDDLLPSERAKFRQRGSRARRRPIESLRPGSEGRLTEREMILRVVTEPEAL